MQSRRFFPTAEFFLAVRVLLFFTFLYIVDGLFTRLALVIGPNFGGTCYQFPVVLGCVPIWSVWEFSFGALIIIYFAGEAHHFFKIERLQNKTIAA